MDFIARHVWLPFGVALLLGIALPGPAVDLNAVIVPLMMVVFFLACLNTDVFEVIDHLRRPVFLVGVLIVMMLVVPAALYLLLRNLDADFALAVLLLSAMPPGMAAPAITEALGGRTSLSLVLCLVASVVSPLTVLLLFSTLTGSALQLDLSGLFVTLVVIAVVPLALAQLVRRVASEWVERTKRHHNPVGVLAISAVIYIATADQAHHMLDEPLKLMVSVLWLYLLFSAFQAIGYLSGVMREKKDRIALAVSNTYMNNALAIGLAASFFGPQILLLAVLSEIPWSTTVGPLQLALKKLP